MDRAQTKIAELQSKISELKRELELSAFLNKGVLGDNDEQKLRIKELEEENRVLRTAESKLAALEDEQQQWSSTLARAERDVAKTQARAALHLKSAKDAHDARVLAEAEAAKWKAKFEESERRRKNEAGAAVWKSKYDEAVAEAAKWRRKCERWRTAHAQSTSLYEDAELDEPEPVTTAPATKPFSLALPAGPSSSRIHITASGGRASASLLPGDGSERNAKRPRISQPRNKTHLATPESLIPARANTDSPATAAVAAALRPTVSPRALPRVLSASAPTTATKGRKRKEPEAEVASGLTGVLGGNGVEWSGREDARRSAKGKEVAAASPNPGAAFFTALNQEEREDDTPTAKRGGRRKSTTTKDKTSTPKATFGQTRRVSINTRDNTRTPTAGTRPPPRSRVQLSESADEEAMKSEVESDSDPLDRWDD